MSNTPTYFPPLDDDFLTTLRYLTIALQTTPLSEAVTYTDVERELLGEYLNTEARAEQPKSAFLELDPLNKDEWIEQEAAGLYQEAKKISTDDRSLEPNEKNQNIKTRQLLLEKLASIREKSVNRQEILAFKGLVLSFLENNLSSATMEKLLAVIEKEKD